MCVTDTPVQDSSIGVTFGLSMLASAALGNLVSDVLGVGMGDVVEATAKKLGLPGGGLHMPVEYSPVRPGISTRCRVYV